MSWPRPVPTLGDTTSAADRAEHPDGWAFAPLTRQALYDVMAARRDVRRFRPNRLPDDLLTRVLQAAHQAPSVGHSQPWRFIVVTEPEPRQRAALLADRERLAQAALLEPDAARHLLDLQLEGIREAPVGIVVCCDRRTAGVGVLGRATFDDADVWSCACAIQNLWLAARAEGLGLGWVTLFQPDDLAQLVGLPEGVVSLGWLCLGWPDERQPSPGLERAGWSARQPLSDVVLRERWPDTAPAPPPSKLRAPQPIQVVDARDSGDVLLTPSGSLGVLDRVVDRVVALGHDNLATGCLVLVGGDHPVADLGVSAFARSVTADVLAAALVGEAVGTVAARSSGLGVIVIDAGASTGDLLHADAMAHETVERLVAEGRATGRAAAERGTVILGEVGIGNTTVAAALSAVLLSLRANDVVGLGAGADSAMLARKRQVVDGALQRARAAWGAQLMEPTVLLAALGGPEFAYLTGVVLGAAAAGQVVILDGLATSVAALCAQLIEPAIGAHLVAGQRSREHAHPLILNRLGLEPLLDLRLRSGEGVGGCLVSGLIFSALTIRRESGRVEARSRPT
jgi:nicotinate-nucleotide--dimethylbenzimidazole phosphoribosyltransferase